MTAVSPKNVLILGSEEDFHARLIHDALPRFHARAHYFDTSRFPGLSRIALDPVRLQGFLTTDAGESLPFEGIHSIYWRNYNSVAVDSARFQDAEQLYIAGNDSRSLIEGLLRALPVKWVNGWEGFSLHQAKPAALAIAARIGARIPRTLLTNDPESVRRFAAAEPAAIFKPVQGGAHTLRVEAGHLTDQNLASLRLAPVALQKEVKGTNVRVFVAGERVMACEVRTGSIDFRDDGHPEIRAIELPVGMNALARATAAALHLTWTGMDYRLTEGGEYFFLEANPSPMFHGFEQATGLPLTEALCALLTS